MDYNKQFNALQECMENFSIDVASEPLQDEDFIINKGSEIIELFGNQLTIDNFKNRPKYFNYLDEQLLKMAQSKNCESKIFEFIDLINFNNCKMTSAILIAITAIKNYGEPDRVCLEYFLINLIDKLTKMDNQDLKNILPIILKHLLNIKKQLQKYKSVLYYFARFSLFALRVNFDTNEFIDICSNIIYNPYLLLEYDEFDNIEEIKYLASFYYLYFKSERKWGPTIYNPSYILEKCLDLALPIFECENFGKAFVKLVLSKFKDDTIQLHMLKDHHKIFINEAAYSSMYDEEFDIRKISIETLCIYMDKLCVDPQYVVFRYMFRMFNSSVKSELILKMRDLICLKITSKQSLGCFQGTQLLNLLRICYNIPDGPKCHIINNKEYVLAVITVIYVLYKYHDTVLDIGKPYVDEAKQFIQTVQSSIDYTTEMCHKDYVKSNNNEKDNEEWVPEHLRTTIDEKNCLLTYSKNAITTVQMQLDLLKDKLSN